MAKSIVGKRDLKREHTYTKQGKHLLQLIINITEEEMRNEERGHELSNNKKEQVENRWEKSYLLTIESHIRV